MDDILLSKNAYRELIQYCYIAGFEDGYKTVAISEKVYESPEAFVKEMIKKQNVK